MSSDEIQIRILGPADGPAWRALRIEMLQLNPEGFHSDLASALERSDAEWREYLSRLPDATFGAFSGERLIGSAGFYVEKGQKLSHKGHLVAVYVAAEFRRRGIAGGLVRAVIGHARRHVAVLLTGSSKAGAPVYRREGFASYGIERDASRFGGESFDDELMAIHFDE